jgi:hypothetical protein
MPLLNPGDQFPRLTTTTTGDQTLTFPDAFAGDFGVVLLYRGSCGLLQICGCTFSPAELKGD